MAVETAEARPAPNAPSDRHIRRTVLPWWALGLIVVVGLALRLWLLNSPLGVVDSDEAVGGLIARHFLDGEIAVFLWGNAWGGTLEALVTAGLFAVVGSSVAAMKLVMVGFYALGCVLTWRVGRRLVDEGTARFAASLLWLFPGSLVLLSIKARLYYGSAMVIALAIVLVALRLKDEPRSLDVAGVGLLLGLGLWTAPFIFYVAVPVGLWLLWHKPGLWRRSPVALAGFVLGALPWIAFNLRNGFPSLSEPSIPVETSYLERLEGFFTRLLPTLLGLRLNLSGSWVLGVAGQLLYLVALAGFVGLVWLTLRRGSRLVPLMVIIAIFPFLFAVPQSSYYVNEPRYGLVLAPVVALLVASGLRRWIEPVGLQLVGLSVCALASVASILAVIDFTERFPGNHDVAAAPLAPLVDELEDEDIETLYADYWIAYRLSFVTEEEIIASPIETVRYPSYDTIVQQTAERTGETTYVVHEGASEEDALQTTLDERDLGYERVTAGDFAVYYIDGFFPIQALDGV